MSISASHFSTADGTEVCLKSPADRFLTFLRPCPSLNETKSPVTQVLSSRIVKNVLRKKDRNSLLPYKENTDIEVTIQLYTLYLFNNGSSSRILESSKRLFHQYKSDKT